MSPKQKSFINWGTAVSIIMAIIAISGLVYSAGGDRTGIHRSIDDLKATDDELQATDKDHEARLRVVETVVTETHTIVQRIDDRMDREHP